MLADHYEYLVQRARQQELIQRARQEHLADIAARSARLSRLAAPLQRMACLLHLPMLRTGSCAVYSQGRS